MTTEITFKVGEPNEFSENELQNFLNLLKKQNKVQHPSMNKVKRCILLGAAFLDGLMVSIAAIKPVTTTDFKVSKANLEHLEEDFENELGYCFTEPLYIKKGFSSSLVYYLLIKTANQNLIATTEIRSNNSMVNILKKNGFIQCGQLWKSTIHEGTLGLFCRYIK